MGHVRAGAIASLVVWGLIVAFSIINATKTLDRPVVQCGSNYNATCTAESPCLNRSEAGRNASWLTFIFACLTFVSIVAASLQLQNNNSRAWLRYAFPAFALGILICSAIAMASILGNIKEPDTRTDTTNPEPLPADFRPTCRYRDAQLVQWLSVTLFILSIFWLVIAWYGFDTLDMMFGEGLRIQTSSINGKTYAAVPRGERGLKQSVTIKNQDGVTSYRADAERDLRGDADGVVIIADEASAPPPQPRKKRRGVTGQRMKPAELGYLEVEDEQHNKTMQPAVVVGVVNNV